MNHVGSTNILLNISLILLFYLVGLIIIFFLKKHNRGELTKIFSLAFFIRVATVFILYSYLISVGGDGFALKDDRKYNLFANTISHELDRGERGGYKESGIGWSNVGYYNFNGWLYHVFDFDTIGSRLVNAFFSALTAIIFYLIFEALFDRQRAKILGYTLALLPNLIFWSSLQFKDTAIIFCSAMLLYVLVCKFRGRVSVISLLLFVTFSFFLWFLRKDYCLPYLAVAGFMFFIKFTKLENIINNARRSAAPKIIILGVLGIGIIVGMMLSSRGEVFMDKMGMFSERQGAFANSNIGFSRYLRITSPTDIYKLPAAVAFTAIAPLPVFSGLTDPIMAGTRLQGLANLGLVLMLPFVIMGFFLFKGEKVLFTDKLLIKWIPLMMLCALSIIYMGNLRYKATLLVYFACWASLAIYERKRIKGKLMMIYGCSFFAIFLIVPIAMIFR